MRRLAYAKSSELDFDYAAISSDNIAAFCEVLIQPTPDAALRFIEKRRAEGVTRQGVYLGYITSAAHSLGKGWETDKYSFSDVTYATGHLYALMRAMRAEGPAKQPVFDGNRFALFATVPGEKPDIGIAVVADMLREVGWEIDLQTRTEHDALVARVEKTRPHIIGLSLSNVQRLDALVRLVVSSRIVMPDCIIGIAPAANIDAAQLHSLADIDFVFKDVRTACNELNRLIVPND